MSAKILIISDSVSWVKEVRNFLSQDFLYDVSVVSRGREGIDYCKKENPKIVLLNLMLSDMSGLDVCKEIRSFSICSIIIVSKKGDESDKLVGLSMGADDYVCNDFTGKELAFRVKAQVRRHEFHDDERCESKEMKIGPFRHNLDEHYIYLKDKLLRLTAREYLLLSYFLKNPNRVINKELIYEMVWGEQSIISDNTVMVHIRHLREKMEKDPSKPEYLVTLKGLGYKLSIPEPKTKKIVLENQLVK